jgi:hypothetical protein
MARSECSQSRYYRVGDISTLRPQFKFPVLNKLLFMVTFATVSDSMCLSSYKLHVTMACPRWTISISAESG